MVTVSSQVLKICLHTYTIAYDFNILTLVSHLVNGFFMKHGRLVNYNSDLLVLLIPFHLVLLLCLLFILGPPANSEGVVIYFTSSSVNISWTESSSSSSSCFKGYRYNVSSTAIEENIIMETTSNSVMVEGLVPSDDQYCVVVTAIDTANRTSNGTDPSCFIFSGEY